MNMFASVIEISGRLHFSGYLLEEIMSFRSIGRIKRCHRPTVLKVRETSKNCDAFST